MSDSLLALEAGRNVDLNRARSLTAQMIERGFSEPMIVDSLVQDHGFSSELVQRLSIYPKGFQDDTDYHQRNKDNAGKSIDYLLRNNVNGETPIFENPHTTPTMQYSNPGGAQPPQEQMYVESKPKKPSDQDAGNAFLQQNREDYVFNLLKEIYNTGESFLTAADAIVNRTSQDS